MLFLSTWALKQLLRFLFDLVRNCFFSVEFITEFLGQWWWCRVSVSVLTCSISFIRVYSWTVNNNSILSAFGDFLGYGDIVKLVSRPFMDFVPVQCYVCAVRGHILNAGDQRMFFLIIQVIITYGFQSCMSVVVVVVIVFTKLLPYIFHVYTAFDVCCLGLICNVCCNHWFLYVCALDLLRYIIRLFAVLLCCVSFDNYLVNFICGKICLITCLHSLRVQFNWWQHPSRCLSSLCPYYWLCYLLDEFLYSWKHPSRSNRGAVLALYLCDFVLHKFHIVSVRRLCDLAHHRH